MTGRPAETRRAVNHKFDIAGHEGFITVGLFEDGQPGELQIKLAKEGSTIAGFADAVAILTSLALQYGVPLEGLVKHFGHMRFEPSGFFFMTFPMPLRPSRRRNVCWFAVAALIAVAGTMAVASAGIQAMGVVAPVYLSGQVHASAVLRVGEISTGYQRRGFFRIGLLPMVVAKGVVVEFRNRDLVGPVLSRIPIYLKTPW